MTPFTDFTEKKPIGFKGIEGKYLILIILLGNFKKVYDPKDYIDHPGEIEYSISVKFNDLCSSNGSFYK